MRRAAALYRPRVEYPSDSLGTALRSVAAMLEGQVGTRVYSVTLGSFDTHADQRGRHDALMTSLDAGLGALLANTGQTEAGRGLLVMVFSEFGRRVRENGSAGTDHGTAGPMFLAARPSAAASTASRPRSPIWTMATWSTPRTSARCMRP